MDDDYEFALTSWAHEYNAYERIAAEHLADVLRPLRTAFDETGEVPDWAGVDLLRAWAFILVRAHRHGGGYGPLGKDFYAAVEAVVRHPAARYEEKPPIRDR